MFIVVCSLKKMFQFHQESIFCYQIGICIYIRNLMIQYIQKEIKLKKHNSEIFLLSHIHK